ncbi:hypothetical protein NL676_003610 [Syzygium grande]|nr:hypothetical protein NL676_003610 [Syzygium grande]
MKSVNLRAECNCGYLNMDLSQEVMLEKQLTGHRVDRSICAWYWDHAISQGDQLQPVIASPTHYLFQIVSEAITFLACSQVEMPPLMGIEFLCRAADVLADYLGGLNEDVIKDNFVIVYERGHQNSLEMMPMFFMLMIVATPLAIPRSASRSDGNKEAELETNLATNLKRQKQEYEAIIASSETDLHENEAESKWQELKDIKSLNPTTLVKYSFCFSKP